MGRNRSFDEQKVLKACTDIFITYGYEGTSIDQLVLGTGLLRGSLYSAFSSKKGVFMATLRKEFSEKKLTSKKLDLCLVALLELAPKDAEIKAIINDFLTQFPEKEWSHELGDRLLTRAAISLSKNED